MLNKIIDQYLKENYYPFHMPGHKRSLLLNKDLGYSRDFTEIDGLDNLNDPKEVFVEMERKIANIYSVKEAIISTNGSTAGILASIRAISKNNKNILIQRSSHKAVYNACLINNLSVDYIDVITNEIGAIVDISYENLDNKLRKNSYGALVITSPSYEGYILDLEKIFQICQNYGTKLIVDMAHGSHLFLTGQYKNTFDLAITSFHKNLQALTPGASVLINDEELIKDVRDSMAIFQTSSPSYLILQSIDEIINNIDKIGSLNENLETNLDKIYKTELNNLELIDNKNKDRSKILISTKNTSINGKVLQELLKDEKIEIEMSYPSYALLIATIFDTNEAFDILTKALKKIDTNLTIQKNSFDFTYKLPEKVYEIYQADIMAKKEYDLSNSVGKVCGEFIYAYPPGIPILAPGELISVDILNNINSLLANNINLNINNNRISCIIDKNE